MARAFCTWIGTGLAVTGLMGCGAGSEAVDPATTSTTDASPAPVPVTPSTGSTATVTPTPSTTTTANAPATSNPAPTVATSSAPERKLTVSAKASLAGGVGPLMQVLVDGVSLGTMEVKATDYTDFNFALASSANPAARIDVVFVNDALISGSDRNLYVQSVVANGRTLRPTDAGVVVDLGSGAQAVDGANVIAGQGDILWNAALRFPPLGGAATAVASTSTSTTAAPAPAPAPAPAVTAPSPAATPSTPPAAAPANAVDITAFGAVCNGAFNNSTAIANAIASAKSKGVAVSIPAGVCAYGDVIRLDGVKLVGTGDGSVLHALDWNREAIFMYGDGVEVRQLKLTAVKAPAREAAWEKTRITVFGAKNFVIDRVTIEGSAAAGIQTAQSANNGRITNNTVKDTLADSIHITDKASYITIENNRVENSGDDGIAVVSYRNDGGVVHHITARNNIVRNNKWGRQMSVVGGTNILYENNYLENNLGLFACLYIAQEKPYSSYGARDVIAQHNTMKNCGGPSTGHGAVMVYSDGQEANANISLIRNDVQQNGQSGIRIFSAMNTGVTVDSNRVQGASPATDITSPGVTLIPYSSGAVGYTAP